METRKLENINKYQDAAMTTAVYGHPDYPLGGLVEEVGEVMGKLAKYARKNNLTLAESIKVVAEGRNLDLYISVHKEMGDVIWNWALLCYELNINPAEVMFDNISKLKNRSDRGVLNGEGDNR